MFLVYLDSLAPQHTLSVTVCIVKSKLGTLQLYKWLTIFVPGSHNGIGTAISAISATFIIHQPLHLHGLSGVSYTAARVWG